MQSPEILWNYKNQQSCERGFRFLKEPQFFADSFFVKKTERVETILFIMSLCLNEVRVETILFIMSLCLNEVRNVGCYNSSDNCLLLPSHLV